MFFKAREIDISINIISVMGTFDEQDRLHAKGRTAAGDKITNARGGFSNHNFGIAFDVSVHSGNRHLPESPLDKAVRAPGLASINMTPCSEEKCNEARRRSLAAALRIFGK